MPTSSADKPATPASPWVFPSPTAAKGHTVDIRKSFRRVVKAAGLDAKLIVRHTLRHTAITHLVQAGIDLPTVKRISGHKTLAMVERYAHANGAHIDAAMSKLQSRMNLLPELIGDIKLPGHDYTETTQTDAGEQEVDLQPFDFLVGRGGFEPPTNGLKVLLSALSTTNQNNLKQLNQ